jgi:phage-related protein
MVRREFVPFDEKIIRDEFVALPAKDRAKLAALIEHYQACGLGDPTPVQIDGYGEGIFRLRHVKPAYAGRLLFFAVDRRVGYERLVILLIFKKEGQKTPTQVLETARRRKREWETNER